MAHENILIVEDEKLIRWSIKSRLEEIWSYEGVLRDANQIALNIMLSLEWRLPHTESPRRLEVATAAQVHVALDNSLVNGNDPRTETPEQIAVDLATRDSELEGRDTAELVDHVNDWLRLNEQSDPS